uniref:Dickkopf WNT signaling pathway inhibitor 1 n=1 Tax=Calidris pygmaea TaxID=425635 RepID=A0A8C3PTS9_9CHAR
MTEPSRRGGGGGVWWFWGAQPPGAPFEIPSVVPSSPRGRAQEAAPRGYKGGGGQRRELLLGGRGSCSGDGEASGGRGAGTRMRGLVALLAALSCAAPAGRAAAPGGGLSSNAIKGPPLGGAAEASAAPAAPFDGSNKPPPAATRQPFPCAEDEDCGPEEFCGGAARGGGAPLCLACRRRRKRCLRDAMCCPGTTCSNGEGRQRVAPECPPRPTCPSGRSRMPTLPRCEEGDFCLRSSDCAAGLCCARHFWSKICKPVLREGQVCTRHRRKGTHSLEIFQRCQCAEGLACRLQREHGPADASRLHTCQRH